MRIAIIANPTAGRGRAYSKILRFIARWPYPNWEVELLPTQRSRHAGALAEELQAHPPDLLAVCGGDGTVNEVVSRLRSPSFPLAILPAGTANVLARELCLPLDPVKSLQVAIQRRIRRFDLGVLGAGSDRCFLFVAGIGFDAHAVYQARASLKAKIGMGAYVLAVCECLRNYTFPEFQVSAGSRTFRATSCLVCNAKSYGGGMRFCPDADMTDGLLDVLILQGKRRLPLVWLLMQSWLGIVAKNSWTHRLRTPRLAVDGPPTVRVQTDGERAGHLPLEIGLAAERIRLIVP